ncbi:MAG: glycosyltransferase, partial [Minisyncoccia bacterium]
LAALEKDYYIIHQTGKTGIDAARIHADTYEHYFPYQFIGAELADIYACADVVLGRAGAGTVNELDYFNIYSVFVPLRPVQNDEQTKNAEWFLQGNDGAMISQAECNVETVVSALDHIQIDLRRDNTCEYTENNAAQLILENL